MRRGWRVGGHQQRGRAEWAMAAQMASAPQPRLRPAVAPGGDIEGSDGDRHRRATDRPAPWRSRPQPQRSAMAQGAVLGEAARKGKESLLEWGLDCVMIIA